MWVSISLLSDAFNFRRKENYAWGDFGVISYRRGSCEEHALIDGGISSQRECSGWGRICFEELTLLASELLNAHPLCNHPLWLAARVRHWSIIWSFAAKEWKQPHGLCFCLSSREKVTACCFLFRVRAFLIEQQFLTKTGAGTAMLS